VVENVLHNDGKKYFDTGGREQSTIKEYKKNKRIGKVQKMENKGRNKQE
jgi:hypothetical protein